MSHYSSIRLNMTFARVCSLHYEKFSDGTVKCIEDEIPFEIPDGWAWARLVSLSECVTDGDHQPPPQTSVGIPFLVISNVASGELSFSNIRYVSKEYYDSLSPFRKAKAGDLLFTVTGSYGIPIPVNTNTPFCFQRHIAIIRPCIIDHQYLAAILGSMYIKKLCDEKATGIAQKTVDLSTLRNFLLPVAPTSEQERILEVVNNALETLSKTKLSADALKENALRVKAKILDLAIRGKLVPQDPADEPASVLLERIRVDKEEQIKAGKIKRDKKESFIFRSEDNSYYLSRSTHKEQVDAQFIFPLPPGWQWCTLSNISHFELGKTLDQGKNTGDYYPYLRSANIKWDSIDLSDLKEMRFEKEELERYTIIKNDLLICEGGDVGRCCVWESTDTIMYQNALHRVRFFENCNPFFFMFYMWHYELEGMLKPICNGVTIKHLTGDVLRSIPFALPPVEEQNRIVAKIWEYFQVIEVLQ